MHVPKVNSRISSKHDLFNKLYITLGLVFSVSVLIMIWISPQKAVIDETYFYPNLMILLRDGLSLKYVVEIENQAPGPLFQLFHYALFQIIDVNPTLLGTRLWNYFFFIAGVFISISSFISYRKERFWVVFFSIFTISFLYQTFMLGHTNAISMFFLASACFCFIKLLRTNRIGYAILFGVFYSLTLVGRQSFLIVYPAFLIIIFLAWPEWKYRLRYGLISILSLVPLLILIKLWGGLVPPAQKMVSGDSIFSVSLHHGAVGLGYFGIMYFLLNPAQFVKNLKVKVVVGVIVASIVIQMVLRVHHLPFRTIFNRLSMDFEWLGYLSPSLLIGFGLYFLFNMWTTLRINYRSANFAELLQGLLLLLIAFSPFKIIHLFSAAYVGQASFLALDVKKEEENRSSVVYYAIRLLLLLLGGLSGLHSVYTYYFH